MYSIEIDTVNRSHVSKNSLYTVLPQYKSFCNKITTRQLCVVSIQRASWCKELEKRSLISLCKFILTHSTVYRTCRRWSVFWSPNQERLPRLCWRVDHWGALRIAAKALHAIGAINQRLQSRSFYCTVFFMIWKFSSGPQARTQVSPTNKN